MDRRDGDNVFEINSYRKKHPLFPPEFRERMIREHKPDAEETVDRIEQMVCSMIVSFVTTLVSNLAVRAGSHVGKKVAALR